MSSVPLVEAGTGSTFPDGELLALNSTPFLKSTTFDLQGCLGFWIFAQTTKGFALKRSFPVGI